MSARVYPSTCSLTCPTACRGPGDSGHSEPPAPRPRDAYADERIVRLEEASARFARAVKRARQDEGALARVLPVAPARAGFRAPAPRMPVVDVRSTCRSRGRERRA